MALYWPDQKVALDIIDDPQRRPFDGDDDYTVLRVSCADLTDYDSFSRIMRRLANLLDCEVPSDEDWKQGNHSLHTALVGWLGGEQDVLDDCDLPHPLVDEEPFDDWGPDELTDDLPADDSFDDEEPRPQILDPGLENVEILATSEEEAARMRVAARADGRTIRKISVWTGPIPEGSYQNISSGVRMSTPEYFFFRKANELTFAAAVQLGCELCGKYRTRLTQYDGAEDDYDYLTRTRTSISRLRTYLRGARGTKECKRARRILNCVADDASSPMACYLYLHLCLSQGHGGYGFSKASLSRAFRTDDGLAPDSSSPFLAYDLVWPQKQVAVQYVGKKAPDDAGRAALEANVMHVVCVTDDDLSSMEKFDKVARQVASLLDVRLPDQTEKWVRARKRLRSQVAVPDFDHMRLTLRDIDAHSDS